MIALLLCQHMLLSTVQLGWLCEPVWRKQGELSHGIDWGLILVALREG